jgi:hypothetical protein
MMQLRTGRWYGLQALPDTLGAPSFSLIFLCEACPDPLEPGAVRLTFIDTCCLTAMRLSRQRLFVLHCTAAYLLARIGEEPLPPTAIALFELTPSWIARCRPDIALQLDRAITTMGVQQALDALLHV